MLAQLLQSGRITDAILLLMALEGAGLGALWLAYRRGIPPAAAAANLAAGACLIMAFRANLEGGGAVAPAYWFAGAFFAHIVDLILRWR